MARATSAFTAIQTAGGLLPPALLQRVSEGDKDLPGLAPEAYHLAPGERLNEAINRSWNRLTGAWETFNERLADNASGEATAQLTRQSWLLPLFQELGYGQLQPAKGFDVEGKHYPISHRWGTAPIHLLGASIDLDHRTPGVAGAAGMSPHGLVQEFLNRSDDQLWGFVSNGRLLRVLRDNVSLTRQAYVEFDLEAIFDDQVYADFTILWLLCHQSRVEGDIPEKCLLEQWAQDSAQRGTRALDQLRAGVEAAITELGAGFVEHPANSELRSLLSSGDLDRQEYYRQLLRLVYRLIFLFVAEDRDLLLRPDADPIAATRFREYYGTARLRQMALDHRGSAHSDLWTGLNVVFGGLSSPAGEPALGLPGLGSFLWSARAVPDLDGTQIENRHLLAAVRALATVPDPSGRVTHSVDYRNLGSEELGSIYESLLELHPEIDTGAGTFSLTTAGGHERKTTGSYYTPTSLINELLDSALDPVLEEAAGADDPETAILALTVLDPACGSGHFLIAAAHRIARRLAEVRTGEGEPTPKAIQAALRDVVARCIHGIDINPMAVELCKVSLWMEAMEPGKPLTFLEHRIVCGNALLGTTPRLLAEGIPDAAFKALEGDDKEVVKALKKRNKLERHGQETLLFGPSANDLAASVSHAVAEIDAMPQDTVAELEAKERRWLLHLHSDELGRAELAANAWCAAFVSRKVQGAPVITDAFVRQALAHAAGALPRETVDEVVALSGEYRFLHPHLAFPDVFSMSRDLPAPGNERSGWTGGFAAVVGNPPWERVRFEESEWLAQHAPELLATKGSRRKTLRSALLASDAQLKAAYGRAVRSSDSLRHLISASGRYPLASVGRVNTYSAFAEMALNILTFERRALAGLVVPSGIATDDSTKDLFQYLALQGRLKSLYDFVNDSGLFPGVGHGRQKFCLLTFSCEPDQYANPHYLFFASDVADLHDAERMVEISGDDLRLLNPLTRTCPVVRTRRDLELLRDVYNRFPIFGRRKDPDRPWPLTPTMLFDMTSDSALFLARDDDSSAGESAGSVHSNLVPLFEAKMGHFFNHRWGDYGKRREGSQDSELPRPSLQELDDPSYEPTPRYWVQRSELDLRLPPGVDWVVGFRDICRSTDDRTVIAMAIPRQAVGNPLPLLLPERSGCPVYLIPPLMGSYVFDFIARQKIGGTHLNLFILAQLPFPPPSAFETAPPWEPAQSFAEWVRTRSIELTYTSRRMSGFAMDLRHSGQPFKWDPQRRSKIQAELDAAMFWLYGIDRADVAYIMDSFPIVKRKDEAAFGEYRSKRLILESYDAMAKSVETGEPYRTTLEPPPADSSCSHPEPPRRASDQAGGSS